MDRREFLASAAATSLATGTGLAGTGAAASGGESAAGFTFPPEWHAHEAVWIGWTKGLFDEPDHVRLRLDMLAALTPHVPVTINIEDEASAGQIRALMAERKIPPDRIDFHIQDTVDLWVRDTGPLFVSDGQRLQIAGFTWGNYGFPWPWSSPGQLARGKAPRQIAERRGYRLVPSDVIAEGGGIDVNSRSLVAYRDATLHRNPGKPLEEIEREMMRLYGKDQVIWLDRAPITDRVFAGPKVGNFFGWGANGHVDEYVRFVSEDTILVAEVSERERDRDALMRLDHEILAENRRQLEQARDPDGRPFNVVTMPVPDVEPFLRRRTLTERDFTAAPRGFDARSVYRDFKVGDEVIDVPAVSYCNFLVTNGVVVGARYGGEGRPDHLAESDERSAEILKEHFPDREVVQIDPLAANWDGGGVHCLTQQQPAVPA
ncbi:agmatine deiminase family protein [Erythrobacter sp.]|jgi:agmatine deiminase|uniref:agmatine deiminase family protein n=1 Tax=Erythrobacter sp. TaxID=1042 RepID=UPI002EADCE18|nr:agmatine deiminase family protein [Erythrobacter sp.]